MEKDNNLDEQQVFKEIMQKPDFEDADNIIISNIVLQAFIAVVMIVIYHVFRRKAPWLYYPNSWKSKSHPCYSSNQSLLRWWFSVINVNDVDLLNLIGLDSFMFLQTIKLLYRIFGILSIFVSTWLCYIYYQESRLIQNSSFMEKLTSTIKKGKTSFFSSISMNKIKNPNIYYIVICTSYIITLFILYFLFIYYKRYMALRQLYLSSPSSMTSVIKLNHLSQVLKPGFSVIESIDIKTRSVIFDRIPDAIVTEMGCLRYIQALGIGDIDDVIIVENTEDLSNLYHERDEIIQDMEKEIQKIFHYYEKVFVNENVRRSFGIQEINMSLYDAIHKFTPEKIKDNDKKRLIKIFFANYQNLYPKKNLTSIKTKLENNKKKISCIKDIIHNKQTNANVYEEIVVDIGTGLFQGSDPIQDVSFFSLRHLLHPIKNIQMFQIGVSFSSRKAIVVFKDKRSAAIASQAKIGSQIFSGTAELAPSPHEILWINLIRNAFVKRICKMISASSFFILNIAFFYLVYLVITSLDPRNKNLFTTFIKQYRILSFLYSGFLTPLVYNILLFFVPIVIMAFINIEGLTSYTEIQIRFMEVFSTFLFFNAFLSAFFSNTFNGIGWLIFSKNKAVDVIKDELSSLGSTLLGSSVFFINTIMQRLFIGTFMVLLKPIPFSINFILYPFTIQTRRQAMELSFSPSVDFGNMISNVLLIFPMAIVYSCIAPMVIFFGFAFYLVNYFVYKNEFLNTVKNEYESGGVYWVRSIRFILYSLIVFHIATAAKFYSENCIFFSMSMIPLVLITVLYGYFIKSIFESNMESFPISIAEEKSLDEFSYKAIKQKNNLISNWIRVKEEEDEDVINIVETQEKETRRNYYSDPMLNNQIMNIILPKGFYRIMYYIDTHDKENAYGLKPNKS